MSLFKSYATQRGFGANLLIAHDQSGKIRKKGLKQLEGRQNVLDYINKEADKIARGFDRKNQAEAENRQTNFNIKQDHSRIVAEQKWKNFETEIENLDKKSAQQLKDRDALLALVPKGINFLKRQNAKRKLDIDDFASEIYRDYGLGFKAMNALVSADDALIASDEKLQAFLREIEVAGDVPMHVIERIRKNSGYLPVAVEKLSAQRWGNQSPQIIAARSNDPINLPGYEGTITLNNASGATYTTVLNKIISEELKDPNTGVNRFSNNIMQLSGLSGAEGSIARTIGHYERKAANQAVKDAEKSRYDETITVIQSFIGPGYNGGERIGAAGIQRAIIHFAGGEDAPGWRLSQSRQRVTDAIINGLKDGQIGWEEVEDLETLKISPRGTGGKEVFWADHFEREWNAIKNAGVEAEKQADKQMVLADQQDRRDGRVAYENALELVRHGNPTPETLIKLQEEFKAHGPSHEKARQVIARKIAYARNTASQQAGVSILKEWTRDNVIITDEMIDGLLLDDETEAFVRAEAQRLNKSLPTGGKEGYAEKLKYRIKGELLKIINTGSGWQNNPGHRDAADMAFTAASGHYRDAREKDMTHEQAYKYARDMITQEIRDEKGDYRAIDNEDGTESHFGVRANLEREPLWEENKYSKLTQELNNTDGMYTKQYTPVSVISKFSTDVNRGGKPTFPTSAMLASSLTRGKISPIDYMVAQTELARNNEIRLKGSTNIQPLPKDYVNSFTKEVEKIPPALRRYLGDMNPVGPNKAYTKAGYQPPIQENYYKKLRPLVSVGDPNAIGDDELTIRNSGEELGFDIDTATIREVLQLMENGHFSAAGDGQWDYSRLQKAAEDAGLPLETLFNSDTQKKLIDSTIKNQGREGFPHVELNEYDEALFGDVHKNLGEEKISSTYWRERAACSAAACKVLEEMGHPLHQLQVAV